MSHGACLLTHTTTREIFIWTVKCECAFVLDDTDANKEQKKAVYSETSIPEATIPKSANLLTFDLVFILEHNQHYGLRIDTEAERKYSYLTLTLASQLLEILKAVSYERRNMQ